MKKWKKPKLRQINSLRRVLPDNYYSYMPLTAPKQAQRPLPPEGTHAARVVRIIHVGTIPSTYMGEERESNVLDITFELVDELHQFKEGDDEKPFVISKEYTLSMGEKSNLRKLVSGILGKAMTDQEAYDYDVEELLGLPCLVTVQHKTAKTSGNVRAEVVTASPPMKGQNVKEPFNTPKLLTYGAWDKEYFETLPDFMKAKIMSSREYREMNGIVEGGRSYPGTEAEDDGIDSNDIPF